MDIELIAAGIAENGHTPYTRGGRDEIERVAAIPGQHHQVGDGRVVNQEAVARDGRGVNSEEFAAKLRLIVEDEAVGAAAAVDGERSADRAEVVRARPDVERVIAGPAID